MSDKDVRHRLDLAVSRALVEPEFLQQLLANPVLAVGKDAQASPEQIRALMQIKAYDVRDFSEQALALFWPG